MTLKKKYRDDKPLHRDRIAEKYEIKREARERLAAWYQANGGAPVKKQANPDNLFDGSSLRTNNRQLAKRIHKHNKYLDSVGQSERIYSTCLSRKANPPKDYSGVIK